MIDLTELLCTTSIWKWKKKLISISFTEKTEVMHLNEVSSMKTNFLLILSFFVKLNFLLKYLFLKLIGSRFLNWIILLKNDNEWSAKENIFLTELIFHFQFFSVGKILLKVPQLELSDAEIFCHKNQSNCNLKLKNMCTICIKKVNEWSAKKHHLKRTYFPFSFLSLKNIFTALNKENMNKLIKHFISCLSKCLL